MIPFHLDWIAGCLALLGNYLVGKKMWTGWLVQLVNLSLLTYINIYFHMWGFFPLNIVLLFLYIRNGWKWYLASQIGEPHADGSSRI